MKLALVALLAFTFAACTRSTLNNSHRELYEPTKRKGQWAQLERDVRNKKDPADPTKRALFRETD
jgi:hypothetical protein